MRREDLVDLNAFLAVAEAKSFTQAAAKLGTSQSALSHTIRRLEARVGVRLLTRTTRSVAPTEAGERLLTALNPAFSSIDAELSAIGELRDKPAGTIRVTASEHAASTVLIPAMEAFLPAYPDVHCEIDVDSRFTDLVSGRFDAGVRLGEALAQDMIAVRIGPDLRMVIAGSPNYFAKCPAPQKPQDLSQHNCINLRFLTRGDIYAWELERDDRDVRVRVEGQLTLNSVTMIVQAAVAGLGLCFVMENLVADLIAEGKLVRVMDDWCQPFSGYHLYYPSRRQPSAAFSLFVDALRYRG